MYDNKQDEAKRFRIMITSFMMLPIFAFLLGFGISIFKPNYYESGTIVRFIIDEGFLGFSPQGVSIFGFSISFIGFALGLSVLILSIKNNQTIRPAGAED